LIEVLIFEKFYGLNVESILENPAPTFLFNFCNSLIRISYWHFIPIIIIGHLTL